ncbi:hypothetical protein EC991_005769, partial [Linnemannia zychae]
LYLYPVDLLSCVQVNRAWNEAFTPFLWHTIDDSTDPWVDIMRKMYTDIPPSIRQSLDRDEWLFSIFAKYGRHVRHLKVQFIALLRAASAGGTCTELKSLVLESGRYGEDEPQLVYMPPPPRPIPTHGQVAQGGGLFGGGAAAFGTAPAAPNFGGLGGLEFGQGAPVPTPPTLPVIELSEPLFPDHLTAADVIPKDNRFNYTVESITAVQEAEWINTQHLWHLVRINPGFRVSSSGDRVFFDGLWGVVPVTQSTSGAQVETTSLGCQRANNCQ